MNIYQGLWWILQGAKGVFSCRNRLKNCVMKVQHFTCWREAAGDGFLPSRQLIHSSSSRLKIISFYSSILIKVYKMLIPCSWMEKLLRGSDPYGPCSQRNNKTCGNPHHEKHDSTNPDHAQNENYLSLKFSCTWIEDRVALLDLTLRGDFTGKVITLLYRKPLAGNTILGANRCCPKRTFCAIPMGDYSRAKRAYSTVQDSGWEVGVIKDLKKKLGC